MIIEDYIGGNVPFSRMGDLGKI